MVKRIGIAILSQDADIAFAIRDLVFASRVVGNVGIRDVFDVPDDTVKHLGDFNVRLVIDRNDLARRAVLTLVVCYLPNVLGQFVDGQAGTSVDRLTLHCATGG